MRKYNYLHQALFENLEDLNKICEKENIKYSPIGATYFSAIDIADIYEMDDDIDLFMHYSDILKISKHILKPHQRLMLPGEDGNRRYMARFYNYKITYIEKCYEDREEPGCFIDLSPWIPVSKYHLLRKIKRYRILRWRIGMLKGDEFKSQSKFKRIVLIFLKLISPSAKKSVKRYQKSLLKKSNLYQADNSLGKRKAIPVTYKETMDTKLIKYGPSKLQMMKTHKEFIKVYGSAVYGNDDPKPFAPVKYSHAIKIIDKPSLKKEV